MEYGVPGTALVIGFIIFIAIIFVIMVMDASGFSNWLGMKWSTLKEKYFEFKSKNYSEWSFNIPIILFGGVAIFMFFVTDGIKKWIIRNKWRIAMTILNLGMILPLLLAGTGVIEQIPEAYFPIAVFYGFILLVYIVGRGDNRRSGNTYHENTNPYGAWADSKISDNKSTPSYTYKPKPLGLTKAQVQRKKRKILEKLIENKELKKKYNLTIPKKEEKEVVE